MSTNQYPLHTFTTDDAEYITAVATGRLLAMADSLKAFVEIFGSPEALPASVKTKFCRDIMTWAKEVEGKL